MRTLSLSFLLRSIIRWITLWPKGSSGCALPAWMICTLPWHTSRRRSKLVYLPELVIGKLATLFRKQLRALPPPVNVGIVEILKFRSGPVDMVDAVGNRIDLRPRKHPTGYFAVNFGNTAGVATHADGKLRHGKAIFARNFADVPRQLVSGNLVCQIVIEDVVTGSNGCMCGECTNTPDIIVVPMTFTQKFQCEKSRMAFVHMECTDIAKTHRPEHLHATDPPKDFLFQTHRSVSAIEVTRNLPVFGRIFRKIRIEEDHGHTALVIAS